MKLSAPSEIQQRIDAAQRADALTDLVAALSRGEDLYDSADAAARKFSLPLTRVLQDYEFFFQS